MQRARPRWRTWYDHKRHLRHDQTAPGFFWNCWLNPARTTQRLQVVVQERFAVLQLQSFLNFLGRLRLLAERNDLSGGLSGGRRECLLKTPKDSL